MQTRALCNMSNRSALLKAVELSSARLCNVMASSHLAKMVLEVAGNRLWQLLNTSLAACKHYDTIVLERLHKKVHARKHFVSAAAKTHERVLKLLRRLEHLQVWPWWLWLLLESLQTSACTSSSRMQPDIMTDCELPNICKFIRISTSSLNPYLVELN